ncbi:MAG: hypothetical protein NVS4B6_26020 [Mycobacterium sp.]
MRGIGPTEPEQLRQHGLTGVEAAPLVLGVRVTLLAEQEASADNGGSRTGIKRIDSRLPA